MITNPPIKGHALLHEGHALYRYGRDGPSEGCECGAKPDPPANSINAMKRWHREHKANLRHLTQIAADITALADHFSSWSFTEHGPVA